MDNDLLDMIAAGEEGSATDIHDKIKDILYNKAAENIDIVKPAVTADMFGGPNPHLNNEEEPEEEEPEEPKRTIHISPHLCATESREGWPGESRSHNRARPG